MAPPRPQADSRADRRAFATPQPEQQDRSLAGLGRPVFEAFSYSLADELRGVVDDCHHGTRDPLTVGLLEIERLPELESFITYTRALVRGTSGRLELEPRGRLLLRGPSLRASDGASAAASIVVVTLAPGAIFALTGIPAEHLAERTIELEHAWGRPGHELAMRLEDTPDTLTQAALIEAAIRQRLPVAQSDRHARAVVDTVARAHSDLRVADLAKHVGYSERQLRRVLATWLGVGPKSASRVTRLRHALRVAARQTTPDWATIAGAVGYHDQSHLSEECRELTGSPPGRLFAGTIAPALLGEHGVIVRRREGFAPSSTPVSR